MQAVPDRSRIVLLGACTRSYIAATDQFTPCGAPVQPNGAVFASFDATAARMTLGSLVLDSGLNLIRSIGSQRVVITPDGQFVLGSGNGFITKMRIDDGIFVDRVLVPLDVEHLFLTPDGAWLLAFSRSSGRIVRVDLR
jgi:hypothetical protein